MPLPRRFTVSIVLALLCVLGLALTLFQLNASPARDAKDGPSPTVPAPLKSTKYPIPPDAIFVAKNGDNSAPGREKSPLRTLSAAVSRAPAGATIVVRNGTYRESVGDIRKRLTIQPFPGEHVWFKGSVVISDFSSTNGKWRHENWSPQLCRTCYLPDIIDPEHPQAGLPDMVFINGNPLRQVEDVDEVTAGSFYVDPENKTLTLGQDPAGKTVEATKFDRFLQFDDAAAGSTIRGIGIAHFGSNQKYGKRGAMIVANAKSVTMENNVFAWSASSGLAVFADRNRITGNSFVANGLVGLMANRADDLRMVGNTFDQNNYERFTVTGESIGAAGAKLTRSKRPYVADNRFVNNFATGWWCDLGCSDATVIRNVARGNLINGLYYEVSTRALVASNLIIDNRTRGLKVSSSDRVRLVHNTFVGNGIALGLYNDPRSVSFDTYSQNAGMSWTTRNMVLLNNYFAGQRSGKPFIESEDHKDEPKPPEPFVSSSDGNVYLQDHPRTPLASWNLGSGRIAVFDSLQTLRAATNQDPHSIARVQRGLPFADPSSGHYTLTESAPGVGAGQPIPADIAAILNVPATSNPDIGILW